MNRTTGSWQYICDLGRGSFGVVSLWTNHNSKKTIAIKRCKKIELSTKQKERWCKEVEIVKNIKHPNIVSYEVLPKELEEGIENLSNLPLLSMEYCNGGNLRVMLKKPCNFSGLQESNVRTILEDIIEALLYLHQLNIVHRDLKPENIVLKESTVRECGVIYKLIDLGFAKELEDTLSLVGTVDYVAPEIFCGQRYNHSVDYWSLGVMAYEIICGNRKYPFPSNVPFVKRLEYLKKKKHEQIVIYESSTGISYSSKIFHRCHLSSWLKEAIEEWLQMPLEFDGRRRCNPNPLHELKQLLKRRLLTVFSIYTLQFYYYEINDCILISTLKTWIYRDTKIDPANQLLLTSKMSGLPSDEDLLINTLPKDKAVVYVFNKYCLWSDFAKLPSPDFLINNGGSTVDKITLLPLTVHFILTEIKHFTALADSILLLSEYNTLLLCDIFTQYEQLLLAFHKVITLIEFFTSIRVKASNKQSNCNSSDDQSDYNLHCIIATAKTISTKVKKLEIRVQQLKRCEHIITNKKMADLHTFLSNHLAELEPIINESVLKINIDTTGNMKTAFYIVSNTIKKRRDTLRHLKSETKCQAFVMEEVPKIKEWMSVLQQNITKTNNDLYTFQSQWLTEKADVMAVHTVKKENGFMDYRILIKDNKAIRLQLEEAILNGLSKFRRQCEITKEFLQDIPKC